MSAKLVSSIHRMSLRKSEKSTRPSVLSSSILLSSRWRASASRVMPRTRRSARTASFGSSFEAAPPAPPCSVMPDWSAASSSCARQPLKISRKSSTSLCPNFVWAMAFASRSMALLSSWLMRARTSCTSVQKSSGPPSGASALSVPAPTAPAAVLAFSMDTRNRSRSYAVIIMKPSSSRSEPVSRRPRQPAPVASKRSKSSLKCWSSPSLKPAQRRCSATRRARHASAASTTPSKVTTPSAASSG
mmetsp:Transcript_140391/g.436515  ORF Transcript_140391/g.436515 Transcript_140391/m.436515 type:complete len:245 (-) Transcript_140391:794-1528(-)